MGKATPYFRCPYCGKQGGHEQRVSKSVGGFRIIKMYDNWFILQCNKCSRVCAQRIQGNVLTWVDMTEPQRNAHQDKKFVNYGLTKSQEDKYGKEI